MDSIFNNDLVEEYMRKKYGQDYDKKSQSDYKSQLERSNDVALLANVGNVIAGQQVGSSNPYFEGLNKRASENVDKLQKEQKDLVDQYLKEKYFNAQLNEKEQDRQLKEMIDRQGLQDRQEARKEKYDEKARKDAELSSAQAKQLGLAEMGQLANKQYREAVNQGYDPTSYSPRDFISQVEWAPQFMKSDAGKKAMAAQSSWVESYLRDASGAAIPPSERGSYAKDYFPRPGDTPEIVANKEALRKQKEKSALIGAGPGAKQFQPIETKTEKTVVKKQFSPSRNQTRIMYSDGTSEVVDGKQ